MRLPTTAQELLFLPPLEARGVVHGAVETIRLFDVGFAQQHPSVGCEFSCRAGLARIGERSARLREYAGQAVDHIRWVATVDIRLVVVVVVLVLSRHG